MKSSLALLICTLIYTIIAEEGDDTYLTFNFTTNSALEYSQCRRLHQFLLKSPNSTSTQQLPGYLLAFGFAGEHFHLLFASGGPSPTSPTLLGHLKVHRERHLRYQAASFTVNMAPSTGQILYSPLAPAEIAQALVGAQQETGGAIFALLISGDASKGHAYLDLESGKSNSIEIELADGEQQVSSQATPTDWSLFNAPISGSFYFAKDGKLLRGNFSELSPSKLTLHPATYEIILSTPLLLHASSTYRSGFLLSPSPGDAQLYLSRSSTHALDSLNLREENSNLALARLRLFDFFDCDGWPEPWSRLSVLLFISLISLATCLAIYYLRRRAKSSQTSTKKLAQSSSESTPDITTTTRFTQAWEMTTRVEPTVDLATPLTAAKFKAANYSGKQRQTASLSAKKAAKDQSKSGQPKSGTRRVLKGPKSKNKH